MKEETAREDDANPVKLTLLQKQSVDKVVQSKEKIRVPIPSVWRKKINIFSYMENVHLKCHILDNIFGYISAILKMYMYRIHFFTTFQCCKQMLLKMKTFHVHMINVINNLTRQMLIFLQHLYVTTKCCKN